MENADDDSDYAVKVSKTAKKGVHEHEFDITLTVTPKEQTPAGANIVLVFDVSTSMDNTVDGTEPGENGWDKDSTRWAALKAAVDGFIAELAATANPKIYSISIVVYGGSTYNSNKTSHAKLLSQDWAAVNNSNANNIKQQYNKYEVVSKSSLNNIPGSNSWQVLRDKALDDDGNDLGETNMQAGFRGAREMLVAMYGNTKNENKANRLLPAYVIFMSDGEANRSYDNGDPESSAIEEAEALKSAYPDVKLFTVGLKTDSTNKVLNPGTAGGNSAVDEYKYADDADALKQIYEDFAAAIIGAAKSKPDTSSLGAVEDPMGAYVSLVAGSLTNASASYNAGTRTITWDVPADTAENGTFTLTYTVRLNLDTEADFIAWHTDPVQPANGKTTLVYKKAVSQKEVAEVELEFPVPTLRADVYEVTFVFDEDNRPEGAVLPDPDTVYVVGGEKVAEPNPEPSAEGWAFAGWYDEDADEEAFDFDTPVVKNLVLVGKWDRSSGPSVPGDTSLTEPPATTAVPPVTTVPETEETSETQTSSEPPATTVVPPATTAPETEDVSDTQPPVTEPPATTTEPPATTAPETEDISDTQPPLEPPVTTIEDDSEDDSIIIVDPEIPLEPLPETGVKEDRLGNLLISMMVAILISTAAAIDLGRTKKSE